MPTPTAPRRGLKLVTVNINGCSTGPRFALLLHFLRTCAGTPDIVLLQEIKCADAQQFFSCSSMGSGPGLPYKGRHYANPGSHDARGVAVLFSSTSGVLDLPDAPTMVDSDGRVLRVDFSIAGLHFSLVNVYAPNRDRASFFASLSQFLPQGRSVLLGGDFNCILDSRRDQSNSSVSRLEGSAVLQQLMHDFHLADAWRVKHPSLLEFTHVATADRSSAARLDRWLVSRDVMPFVTSAAHVQGAPGDHTAVVLVLSPPNLPAAGPGLWRFPVHLLQHPEYSTEIRQAVAMVCQQAQADGGNYQQHWQALKLTVRELAMLLHQRDSRSRLGEQLLHLSAARMADIQFAKQPTSPITQQQRTAAFAKLRKQQCEGCWGQSRAAAALWGERGERGTKWFHSLAGHSSGHQPITSLQDAQGAVHSFTGRVGPSLLDAVAAPFYSSTSPSGLFRPTTPDMAAQDRLLGCLEQPLDSRLAREAEGPTGDGTLTLGCLATALCDSANGKAPGPDGLPIEFYRKYWDLLGPLLVLVANEIFASGVPSMPEVWARGVILPIFKGKGLPRDVLSSYRPITLLNVDFKLVSKAVADRMQLPLDSIVDPCQTAFIKGRWIGDNVLFHLGMAEHLAAVQQPGAVIILDIEKAYDRTNRPWLYRVAETCGFAGGMQRWIRLLTSGTTSRVTVNGWLSSSFPVTSGLPQGSPLSPLLWNLQLQPLTARLKQLQREGRLQTPLLPNGMPSPPVYHHADDTKLTMQNADVDGPVAMSAVHEFCAASAAKVHPDKSKGVTLGSHAAIVGRHLGTGADFGQVGSCSTILGIPLTADSAAAASVVFTKRITTMQHIARMWSVHPLSLVGRALIAKQVMANSVTYHATFVPPNDAQLRDMQQVIAKYVAVSPLAEDAVFPTLGGPTLQPRAVVAALPRDEGGVALVDLASHVAALQGKIIAAVFSPGEQPWKVLMRHTLTAAAPCPQWGPGWVATALPVAACPTLPPRIASYVAAYRATRPRPFHPAAADAPCCLASQPLYFNANIAPAGGPHFLPPDPLPAAWPMTLHQLASASAVIQQHPAVQPIIQAALAQWPDHLAAIQDCLPPESSRWLVDPQRGYVADTACQPPKVFQVQHSGRLHSSALRSVQGWQAACVLRCPKPRHLWTYEELQHYNEQLPKDKPQARPLEDQYLGPWVASQHGPGIPLFPGSWGHVLLPLHQYAVKTARDHLVLLLARDTLPGYQIRLGLQPRLWQHQQAGQDGVAAAAGAVAGAAAAAAAPAPPEAAQSPTAVGPQRLCPWEQGWVRQINSSNGFHADPLIFRANWMQRSAPRQHPRDRVAARAAVAGTEGLGLDLPAHAHFAAVLPHAGQPGPLPQPDAAHVLHAPAVHAVFPAAAPVAHVVSVAPAVPQPVVAVPDARAVAPAFAPVVLHTTAAHQTWRRLWCCPADNHCKVLGWRLLHASLPVRAYRVAQRGGTLPMARCQQPACLAQGRRGPYETYTHLFMDCPAARPAMTWLRRLWAAVAGATPPDDAMVLLGDHAPSWPDYPREKARQHLWTFLRLTVLHQIWDTRHKALPADQQTAAAMVRRCIMAVVETMQRLFYRSTRRQHLIEHLPLHLLTEEVLDTSLEGFMNSWCMGDALCSVVLSAGDGQPRLLVRLSEFHPVPLADLVTGGG